MKNKLSILSIIIGALAYLYMVLMTIKGTGEGLSLSTFGLWAALAWITSFSMLKQGANPAVPMVYGLGSTATTIVLLIKGRYGWTGFDTTIAISFAACVCLLLTSGPRWALVLSVFSSVLTATPFIVMTWTNPQGSPIVANTGFLLANILSFVSAKAWTLEDKLYPGANIIVCGLLVLPWLLS
jgi:hypothetical protein